MKLINALDKAAGTVSHWLNWIAGAGLLAMLGLFVADIIGIKLLKHPVPGAIEFVGFLGVVVIAFALANTEVRHGNIQVDFFVEHMPPRLRAISTALVSLLSAVLFAILAWQSFLFGRTLQTTNEVSMTQNIPFYPFVYGIAFCSLPICLVLLVKFLKAVMKAAGK
ncbi:MAG: TRAP transporter small permease [Dehalococcoidales bacterium]|nr:TRAP transporter small permease [Dehalococcoidales bacterium]